MADQGLSLYIFSKERRHHQNRQNTPTVTFACAMAPLPINVRWRLSGGPVERRYDHVTDTAQND
jgi:hypothetical protein